MTSVNKFTDPIADTAPIEQSNLEELIELQTQILGATVTSNNYEELLKQVCLFAEKLTPDAVASVMLYDKNKQQLFVKVAPSIPSEAVAKLNGLTVGDGSCGNAVYHNKDMFVCDTLTDGRWENVRCFAEEFKIHACWSSPIQDESKEPIGSFAMSSFAKRTPDNFQRRLLNSCASIAGIILQRESSLEAMRADRKKLIDSQQQYRSLVNNSADAIFLHDDNGNLIDVNQMACDSLGYTRSELLELQITDVIPNDGAFENFKDFCESLNFDETYTFNDTHTTKDGNIIPIEARVRRFMSNNQPLTVALSRDITERKEEEEEILKARKLDSIGLLAGGIAHDFNNMLGIIQGYVDLATRSVHNPEKTTSYLQKATNAAVQAADLTQQLLTFSKGGEPIKQAANMLEIIHQSADFSLHGSNINVIYKNSNQEDLWMADVDSGQISQVIQNLVINARQAMPEGGDLEIFCDNCVVTETDKVAALAPKKYIRVSVKDNGVGIPQDIIESIFDPYFTTKQQGSGLGLALSYSIINKHEGNISVESSPGEGTTFTLYLPVCDKPEVVEEKDTSKTSSVTSNKRIMIMDDDELLREVSEEMLINLGYDVVQSQDGHSALEKYKSAMETNENIDLVIMDLTIPSGIGGKEAIKLLQEIDPKVKALVSSGYCNDPVMANYDEYGFMGAVRKPYSQDELGEAVNSILQQ